MIHVIFVASYRVYWSSIMTLFHPARDSAFLWFGNFRMIKRKVEPKNFRGVLRWILIQRVWITFRSVNVFKPFAIFFFFISHFQSRNNIMDRLFTSSVSYSRLEYYTKSRFRIRHRPTRRKHWSGAFIDRPSSLKNSLLYGCS